MNIDLTHLVRNKLNVFVGILAIAVPVDGAVSVSFKQLIQNPRAYQGKRVSVIGVAAVDETTFVLFQPPHRELSQTIFVAQKVGERGYAHLDNHWVEVAGVADIDKENIFACKIFLESVQPLPRPPVKGGKVFGVFFHEGPNDIRLDIANSAGNEHSEIPLSAGQIEKIAIVEGVVKVFDASGKLLSQCAVKSEKSAPELFDASTRTFYFRIRNGKIAAVPPKEATPLKKRWEKLESKGKATNTY